MEVSGRYLVEKFLLYFWFTEFLFINEYWISSILESVDTSQCFFFILYGKLQWFSIAKLDLYVWNKSHSGYVKYLIHYWIQLNYLLKIITLNVHGDTDIFFFFTLILLSGKNETQNELFNFPYLPFSGRHLIRLVLFL